MASVQVFVDDAALGNRPSVNLSVIGGKVYTVEPLYARHRRCRDEQHVVEQTRECQDEYAAGWCCDDCGRQFRPAERMLREHCAACSTDRCAPCMNRHVEADATAPAAAGAD